MKDHYNVLGINENAQESEIKKAYRSLSLKYHPDRNSSQEAKEKMTEINEAFEVLGDSQSGKNMIIKENLEIQVEEYL